MNTKTVPTITAIAAGTAVLAVCIVGCGSAKPTSSTSPTSSSASAAAAAASSASAAAASTTALPSGGQQYASDMRAAFSFGSAVSDSDLANFGQQTCQDLQSGNSIAAEVPTAQQSWTNISSGDAIQMIILAVKDMCPSQQAAQTVTYVVSGTSGAQVTYGPSGSNLSGTVPMSVTQPLGNPSYYAINAQLQGYGDVSCKLEVDGVTISSATASGGYNIADCEIGQNMTTGSWENDNSG